MLTARGAMRATMRAGRDRLSRQRLDAHSCSLLGLQLLREGKWTFNTFLRSGLLEYLGEGRQLGTISQAALQEAQPCYAAVAAVFTIASDGLAALQRRSRVAHCCAFDLPPSHLPFDPLSLV